MCVLVYFHSSPGNHLWLLDSKLVSYLPLGQSIPCFPTPVPLSIGLLHIFDNNLMDIFSLFPHMCKNKTEYQQFSRYRNHWSVLSADFQVPLQETLIQSSGSGPRSLHWTINPVDSDRDGSWTSFWETSFNNCTNTPRDWEDVNLCWPILIQTGITSPPGKSSGLFLFFFF